MHAVSKTATDTLARAHARAARTWAARAGFEREAAGRFARMAARLEAVSAEPVVTGLARRAAADEQRHAALCEELAARFDGRPSTRRLHAAPAELGPSGLTVRERVLYEVVAMSCITETLSTAVLGEMRDRAVDARVRDVLSTILRDEVQHARLGWAHLAAERRRGPLRFVAEALPRMLDDTASDEIFRPGEPDADDVADTLRGLGALPRVVRRRSLVDALEQVVFPGLEALGVDAGGGRAWLTRRAAA